MIVLETMSTGYQNRYMKPIILLVIYTVSQTKKYHFHWDPQIIKQKEQDEENRKREQRKPVSIFQSCFQ